MASIRYIIDLKTDLIPISAQIFSEIMENLVLGCQTLSAVRVLSVGGYIKQCCALDHQIGDVNEETTSEGNCRRMIFDYFVSGRATELLKFTKSYLQQVCPSF
jgi:hypothetical protein